MTNPTDTTTKTSASAVLTDLRNARNELALLISRCANQTHSRADINAIEDKRIEIERLENEYDTARKILYAAALKNQRTS